MGTSMSLPNAKRSHYQINQNYLNMIFYYDNISFFLFYYIVPRRHFGRDNCTNQSPTIPYHVDSYLLSFFLICDGTCHCPMNEALAFVFQDFIYINWIEFIFFFSLVNYRGFMLVVVLFIFVQLSLEMTFSSDLVLLFV